MTATHAAPAVPAPVDAFETPLERAVFLASETGLYLDHIDLSQSPDTLAVLFQHLDEHGDSVCNQLLVAKDASNAEAAAALVYAVALDAMLEAGGPVGIEQVRCRTDVPEDSAPFIAFSRELDVRADAPAANLAKMVGLRLETTYPVFKLLGTEAER